MRFVCISIGNYETGVILPVIGNVYTLLDTKDVKDYWISEKQKAMNGTYYQFIELPHWHYHDQFLKINEDQIDEAEMKREYNHQSA